MNFWLSHHSTSHLWNCCSVYSKKEWVWNVPVFSFSLILPTFSDNEGWKYSFACASANKNIPSHLAMWLPYITKKTVCGVDLCCYDSIQTMGNMFTYFILILIKKDIHITISKGNVLSKRQNSMPDCNSLLEAGTNKSNEKMEWQN